MLGAALDLATRRMPPADAPRTLKGLLRLLSLRGEEVLAEELLSQLETEQPLEEAVDPETGRPFLLTPYSREGEDSHRSPWSNKYYPPLPTDNKGGEADPYFPSEGLRALEVEANELWQVYGEMYFGGEALGSVYLWNHEGAAGDGGFAGCFAMKKRIKDGPCGLEQGGWDALHVAEALPTADGRSATYEVTSTVLLSLAVRGAVTMDASSSLTRRAEASHPIVVGAGALSPGQQHLAHMGRMVEDLEIQIRGDVDALYLQRTREVVHAVRKQGGGQPAAAAAPPVRRGGVPLPGMMMMMGGEGPPGHHESLLAAINKRRVQRQEKEGDEDAVEG